MKKLENFDSSKLTEAQYKLYNKLYKYTNGGRIPKSGIVYFKSTGGDLGTGFYLGWYDTKYDKCQIAVNEKFNKKTVKSLIKLGGN